MIPPEIEVKQMGRIRTIKPSFFKTPSIADLPIPTRLTYIGLWTMVDDAGRSVDDPRLVKADVWPLDDSYTTKKVGADLTRLAEAGKILRYRVGGRRFFSIVGWDHQKISHPTDSTLPPPPEGADTLPFPGDEQEDSGSVPGAEHEASGGKGKEGSRKGKELAAVPSAPEEPSRAHAVVKAYWDEASPKPASTFIGVVKIVERLLDAGWSERQVGGALHGARTHTLAAIEFVLRQGTERLAEPKSFGAIRSALDAS